MENHFSQATKAQSDRAGNLERIERHIGGQEGRPALVMLTDNSRSQASGQIVEMVRGLGLEERRFFLDEQQLGAGSRKVR